MVCDACSNGIQSDIQVLRPFPVTFFLSHICLIPSFSRVDTLNFGVKASDGALQEFIRHAQVKRLKGYQEFCSLSSFYKAPLIGASTSVAFEKVEQKRCL